MPVQPISATGTRSRAALYGRLFITDAVTAKAVEVTINV